MTINELKDKVIWFFSDSTRTMASVFLALAIVLIAWLAGWFAPSPETFKERFRESLRKSSSGWGDPNWFRNGEDRCKPWRGTYDVSVPYYHPGGNTYHASFSRWDSNSTAYFSLNNEKPFIAAVDLDTMAFRAIDAHISDQEKNLFLSLASDIKTAFNKAR